MVVTVLSRMKWVSASSALAGVLGVAGLVLALTKDRKTWNLGLPWFDDQRKDNTKKFFLVPGLQNLGNNCFLNVILQALASCSYFQPSLQKVIEGCESSSGECSESLQLTLALADLLEELCMFGGGRIVLSPRKVMLAMSQYIENFNLMSQQDAEEAFLHLLSSLREEFSDCYPSNQSSLAAAFASSNCRILAPNVDIQNEQERWQQHFLGPFDGILSSILRCQSCSSEISLNFQFFHSLPLLPVLAGCATIRVGCTLEDCLEQFAVSEKVENYNCSHCWHIAAIKYLTLRGGTETEIEKLRNCSNQDSCSCHNIVHLESLPWSNKFSRTLKELSIARCPKILCIHLQRASINHFGEQVKLQGHISFPSILNLRPFMLNELQSHKASPHVNHFDVQYDTRMLSCIYERNLCSKLIAPNETENDCPGNIETFLGQSNMLQTNDSMSLQINKNANAAYHMVPSGSQLYRLVSVVEHFGKAGGGHYTVYRSVKSESSGELPDDNYRRLKSESGEQLPYGNLKPSLLRWFCISDSKVYSASEEDVLAAEASLLFYERIA